MSKKTFALVVGESAGASKLTKAETLGVPILDEVGFEHVLATGELRPPTQSTSVFGLRDRVRRAEPASQMTLNSQR